MKYTKKPAGLMVFFQILVCLFLLLSCVYIHLRQSEQTVAAGTFGNTQAHENITFTDLARHIERMADIS